jgi:hypothetical protein
MIVREQDGSYVLVRQHEHARVSGEFARHWAVRPMPPEPVIFAIANHDIGWEELDDEVLFDPKTGRPYSFTDYPIEPKLRAYTRGIDLVEARDPYAALLCSMHYASFVRPEQGVAAESFLSSEFRRQERLRAGTSGEQAANLEYNFRLLQLCDNLSLFVCLNEPGRNEHPWFRDGFEFMGERLEPVWDEPRTLRIRPSPLSGAFEVSIPYRRIGGSGRPAGTGSLEIRVAC